MLEILQMFNTYLPKSSDAAIGVDGQLFSGDQLTVERTVNVIASVANGRTPQDRLDWIHLQLGDWHASVKLLSVSVHIGVLELQSRPFKTQWRAKYTTYFLQFDWLFLWHGIKTVITQISYTVHILIF